MCQAKPGPRCSNHTGVELAHIKELAKQDPHNYTNQMFETQLDYYSTKKGSEELSEAINDVRAKVYSFDPEDRSPRAQWHIDKWRKLSRIKEAADFQKEKVRALVEVDKSLKNGQSLQDIDPKTLKNATLSPRITDELAEKFRENPETDHLVARNPYVSPSTLDKISNSGSRLAKEAVAGNRALDDSTQAHIAMNGSNGERRALAGNSNLTKDNKNHLINNSTHEVLKVLAHRSDNTPEQAQAIINSKGATADIVHIVASRKTAFPSTIEVARQRAETDPHFSESDRTSVYYAVAQNHNASPSTLRLVVGRNGSNHEVEENLSANPNADSNTLDELSKRDNRRVLENLAENPNTPSHVLKKLAQDEYRSVREKAVEHPAYS